MDSISGLHTPRSQLLNSGRERLLRNKLETYASERVSGKRGSLRSSIRQQVKADLARSRIEANKKRQLSY